MARPGGERAEEDAKRRASFIAPASVIQGQHVRMDRAVDCAKPCCDNVAIIGDGRGPHAAELRCTACGAHRGWLSKSTYEFLLETVQRFGVSAEPFVIHDATTESKHNMHTDTLYPSKWMKASDLDSKARVVTIDKVRVEEVGTDRERRPVCSFVGNDKQLILNKTNCRAISDLYGPETDAWHGKKIVIFPTTTQYGDKEMAAIRVRAPKDFVKPEVTEETEEAAPSAPKTHDDMDDEIPF
jgi:hypothetical protein